MAASRGRGWQPAGAACKLKMAMGLGPDIDPLGPDPFMRVWVQKC